MRINNNLSLIICYENVVIFVDVILLIQISKRFYPSYPSNPIKRGVAL